MKKIILQELSLEELSEHFSARMIEKIKPYLPKEKQEEFLTRNETAKFLKISLPTLHQWTKDGRLISYRISNRIRYKRSEIISAMKERPYLKNN